MLTSVTYECSAAILLPPGPSVGAAGHARTDARLRLGVAGPGASLPATSCDAEGVMSCPSDTQLPKRSRASLAVRDLSDPREGAHAMQRLVDDIVTALRRAWACDVLVHRGARIVDRRRELRRARLRAATR